MLPDWYSVYKKLIDKSIKKYLSEYFNNENNNWLNTVKEATFYAVKWWKRIRSILALEFYLIFSRKKIEDIKEKDPIIKFCIAIELLHWYSLVHDDLPALDNDNYRRGELTTWKNFWEATGILTWDLLNSLAFEILWETNNLELVRLFWKAVWIKWMLWWQVLDLYYENNPDKLTIENLLEIHDKKTWALIEISVIWWILLSENITWNKNEIIKKYSEFWKKIWLAFQVKDDLLDVEWTFEETWKSVWWENKWFIYFMWIEKTKEHLSNLLNECFILINEIKSEKIEFIVWYIWSRKK
jgi:geranylgeranyl diphosphate synthase, type II